MAKFDIFDKSSWAVEITDREKAITNKAVGRIGQMIFEIRELKSKIEKACKTFEQTDYTIAQTLMSRNLEAYKIMEISYDTNDAQVTEVLTTIDEIEIFWKDVSNRNSNWKCLLPKLKILRPYLESRHSYSALEIAKLVTIKVSGNKAWEEYLYQAKESIKWYNYWKKASEKLSVLKENALDDDTIDNDDYDDYGDDE